MLKVLLKKQFKELFRSYFVNAKTGKARSRGKRIGLFLLFGLLMLVLAASFFAIGMGLGMTILDIPEAPGVPDVKWLYFALMGIISIIFGTFGSVFNTYSTLYMAKDNETLLSMPIPPRTILVSRMASVYGLSLLYSGGVWLPSLIASWIITDVSAAAVVLQVLLLFFIPLFVTALSCALGWVVALIASKVKGKGIITALIALGFLIPYYYLCFNTGDFMTTLANNTEGLSGGIKTWGNLFYQLGKGSVGQIGPFLLFAGIAIVLFVVCYRVLSGTFLKIALAKPKIAEKKVQTKALKATGVKKALFRRELKRFASSSTYMLNTGLGTVFAIAIPIIVFVKRADIMNIFDVIPPEATVILNAIPLAIAGAFCLLMGMDTISTPSVSLDGKNLWIIRSMPVAAKDVLQAKLKLHVVINAVPTVPAVFITELLFGYDFSIALFAGALVLCFVYLTGEIGLMLGILKPNFTWTTEAQLIKQSVNVLIMMLVGLVLILLIAAGYYFTRNLVDIDSYMIYAVVALEFLTILVRKWLETTGAQKFEEL